MRSRYDPDVDILYIRFIEKQIIQSEEVADGVVLDLDEYGRIVAIEVLNASDRLAKGAF